VGALITQPIDARRFVRLSGNTRPEANARNDRGRAADTLSLEHMQLLLRRPAERELALQRLIQSLQDRTSPNYHHWLTAAQLARDYGPSSQDLTILTDWLQQQGFSVNSASPATLSSISPGRPGRCAAPFTPKSTICPSRAYGTSPTSAIRKFRRRWHRWSAASFP
jgi:hypothetical protein